METGIRRLLCRGGLSLALLAVLAAGCGGAPKGAGQLPPIGDGAEARLMVETVAAAARAAVTGIPGNGGVVNVPVEGEDGTATITGEVFHTETSAGTNVFETIDADVDIVFEGFRTTVPSGITATVTGTVDFRNAFPPPGAGQVVLRVDRPIEVSGDVAASYAGTDADGAFGRADSFSFAASALPPDALRGSLTTLAGRTFRF